MFIKTIARRVCLRKFNFFLAVSTVLFLATGCGGGGIFTVNNSGDSGDTSPGDGYCRTGTSLSECTLRAAMQEANALAGAQTILFALPAHDQTIYPLKPLPEIIEAVTIDGTSQPEFDGGKPVVRVDDSSLAGNSALNQGGGIYGDGLATATVLASTINGNSAGVSGGGLFLSGLPAGDLKVTNSTISGNHAGTNGGGIWGEGGILELSFVTITGNSATIAGGIVNNGTIHMLNSVVADNIGNNCFSQDPPSSYGFNLDDDSTCLFTG